MYENVLCLRILCLFLRASNFQICHSQKIKKVLASFAKLFLAQFILNFEVVKKVCREPYLMHPHSSASFRQDRSRETYSASFRQDRSRETHPQPASDRIDPEKHPQESLQRRKMGGYILPMYQRNSETFEAQECVIPTSDLQVKSQRKNSKIVQLGMIRKEVEPKRFYLGLC